MRRRPATAAEAKALANPLRLRILRLCLDEGLTNQQLAQRLDRDPGTILHHVQVLTETGFLAPTEPRRGARGALERPYRATGKSWTLDVGEQQAMIFAALDAFRDEVAEAGPRSVLATTRLGVRLTPGTLRRFRRRFDDIVRDLHDADDPRGQPVGIFIGVHRRRTD